jgi:hypothetical protein
METFLCNSDLNAHQFKNEYIGYYNSSDIGSRNNIVYTNINNLFPL